MTDDIQDDITMEPSDEDGSEGTPEQKLKILRDKYKAAKAEAGDNLAGWQRAKADYVNLQKRMREDSASLSQAGLSALALELLPVYDSLEAAHAIAPDGDVKKGIEATMRQLDSSFKAHGIIKIVVSEGDVFNPHAHEPVQTVATAEEKEDNTVARVLQNGFQIDDSVLRPARVAVKHYTK